VPKFVAAGLLKSFEIFEFLPKREYSKLNFWKSSLLKNEFKALWLIVLSKTGNDTPRIGKSRELAFS